MSRLGKQPITVPAGVDITFADSVFTVKGPKGTLTRTMKDDVIGITFEDNVITFAPRKENKQGLALWGTYAAHLHNMIKGVTEGFTKILEIEGVGYRAEVRGNVLALNVGFSHVVELPIPEGVSITVEKGVITVMGPDKETLGQYAANIRATRPPEPYKGKGIHYQGEYIIRKQGKKAV
ncbi:MAG: 50S ribosomal protein L6 [Candidatus Paceibacterota bacterium]